MCPSALISLSAADLLYQRGETPEPMPGLRTEFSGRESGTNPGRSAGSRVDRAQRPNCDRTLQAVEIEEREPKPVGAHLAKHSAPRSWEPCVKSRQFIGCDADLAGSQPLGTLPTGQQGTSEFGLDTGTVRRARGISP